MTNIYRFSPIKNEGEIDEALAYMTLELEKLSDEVIKQVLPINTLKIFAHYQAEYDYLHSYVVNLGENSPFSSDTSRYAKVARKIENHNIEYIGVRIVDPYRLHVGCGDYEIENFNEIKEKYKGTSPYIRVFSEDMLEIWHPDFDVLGYIVPKIQS